MREIGRLRRRIGAADSRSRRRIGAAESRRSKKTKPLFLCVIRGGSEEFDESRIVFGQEKRFERLIARDFAERAFGGSADDGAEGCGARLHGAAEILPRDHEEGNAVFEQFARLAGQDLEEAFFDGLRGFGVGFGLAERGEERGDGVVGECVEEGGAGDGLMHGVGRPKIELYGVAFVKDGIVGDKSVGLIEFNSAFRAFKPMHGIDLADVEILSE